MSSRELALQGKQKARPTDIDSAIMIADKSASVAKEITPNFAKKGLTGIKHMGEWGVEVVTDSRLGKYAANKVGELANKVRTGQALQFNAGKALTSLAGIKTIGDLSRIDAISQIMIVLIAIIFFMIFWWCYNKLNLDKQNCKKIEKVFSKFPYISNINTSNPIFQHRLRDYYIKTAYNCCASGNYKNDFVNLCALKNCIKQGARCLDFEIYSIDNMPVIAVSTSDSFNMKESYNNVPFAKAMDVIATYAFSSGNCPNPDDPLILHFRIKSSSQDIQNAMAYALYNTLEDRLLGPDFSYENNGLNIGALPLANITGKVVIIVDKSNPIFTETLFNEYVNLASNSAFMRGLRYKDVEFTPDKEELIFFNQQNMTICLPDLSAKNTNYSSPLAMTYGCQMIAMSFQNFDDNLKFYTQYFDDAGTAFVLRPERLRYIPVFIPIPPAQNPAVSSGTTTTNPLGPNGPASLDINITTDYGRSNSSCPADDTSLIKDASIECIKSIFSEYGKCTLNNLTKDPKNPTMINYIDDGKPGSNDFGNTTVKDMRENALGFKDPKMCTRFGGTIIN